MTVKGKNFIKNIDFWLLRIRGFLKTTKIIPVKNHINKMGKNPFKNESKTKVVFYDITSHIKNKQVQR